VRRQSVLRVSRDVRRRDDRHPHRRCGHGRRRVGRSEGGAGGSAVSVCAGCAEPASLSLHEGVQAHHRADATLARSGVDERAAPAQEDSATSSDSLNEGAQWKVLDVDYQVQQNGYWCGPASTRIAISARRGAPSQADLARQLGTTTNGTDWIGQVTNTLNAQLG